MATERILIKSTPGTPQKRTDFESLFTDFLSYIDVKNKSAETYAKAIKQFFVYLKKEGIQAPTRADIIAYREELTKSHKPATVQLYISAVKLFFSWLGQRGIYSNIADKVKAPAQDRGHKKSYLTDAQAARVLQAAKDNRRNYALLSLMMTTGIRTIEASRANIEDLDTIAGQPALYIQGKGHDDKKDYVKIAPEVENALRDYLQTRAGSAPADPLFISESNRSGGRLTTRSISRIAKETMKSAGFNSERLTAHSLRHTAAHLNLENGGTVEETRELLRHANVETTYIYINEMNREKNNSENRIAAAIFKGIYSPPGNRKKGG